MLRVWLRIWARNPVLTGQFVTTIAVGIAGTSALVSLLLALGYQPLPFRDPDRLVAAWELTKPGANMGAFSGPDLMDFADGTHNIFSSLDGFATPELYLFDTKGSAKISGCFIQAGAMKELGIRPVLGREVQLDDQPFGTGAISPVWISSRLWQTRYDGSPSVIGATIAVASTATGEDKAPLEVAGVLPPRVSIPLPWGNTDTDLWYLAHDAASFPRQATVFFGIGRLRPGVSSLQAQAAMTAIQERLGNVYQFDRNFTPVVRGLEEIAQGPARQTMGLLSLGVALVFLIACVNLAILMSAEGMRRRREIAVRAVLGAGRGRLWIEVAAEKCALTLVSAGLGAAIAFSLLRALARLIPAAGLGSPLEEMPALNLTVLLGFSAFALAAALVWSALLVRAADGSGSARALAAAGGPGYTGTRDTSPRSARWRLVLLAAQAGIGICLLAAAMLTARVYAALSVAALGPSPSHTVLLSVSVDSLRIPSDAEVAEFNRQLLTRLERLPGTQAIALADSIPPHISPEPFRKLGDSSDAQRDAMAPMPVSPGYFRAFSIPILFGRGFDDTDNSAAEPVAIISLDMAEQNWPSPAQAVGSEILYGKTTHYKVVGVAGNFTGFWSRTPLPAVYLPLAQGAYHMGGDVVLRTSGSVDAIAALAPQALSGMPGPATIFGISTVQSRWAEQLTRPMARMAGMLLLALLGFGLGIQGVYAVAAGVVAAKRHELCVRAALGAPPNRLAWSVTRNLVTAVLTGATLGVAAAVDLRPLMQRWLGPAAVWQTEPIAAAVVLLALAAALGCYFPARAAVRANPAEVLREG